MKLILATLLALGAVQAPPTAQRFTLSVQEVDGDFVCSIQARQARLIDLLEGLGERMELSVQGLEFVPRQTRVSVDLRRRPVREALDYILGGVGLEADQRPGAIVVREDLALSLDELHAAAQASYLRALREYPNHELAPEAMFGQAQIEESSGNIPGARTRYDDLVNSYPESELVPRALARSADLFVEEEEWGYAAQRYSDLLRLEYQHGFEVEGFIQLALCTTMLGDHQRAIHMLDAFDAADEHFDREAWMTREYVRVRAYIGLKQLGRAAALLDDVDAWAPEGKNLLQSKELHARLLGAKQHDDEAARAWLSYAQAAEGVERTRALRRAARHALESGDEMGVFFIERYAEELGSDADLSDVVQEARTRLGIDDGRSKDVEERLLRAERLIAAGATVGLMDSLAHLQLVTSNKDESFRTRVLLARATVIAEQASVDEAIELFRAHVSELRDPENRRRLYLLAAQLLEQELRMDEAIEAYQGRL